MLERHIRLLVVFLMQGTGLLNIYGPDEDDKTRTLKVHRLTTVSWTTTFSPTYSAPLEAPILSHGAPMVPFNPVEAASSGNHLWYLAVGEMRRLVSMMLCTLIPVSTITTYHTTFRRRSLVLNLVFITRYMRPEGPWQRLAAALADNGGLF